MTTTQTTKDLFCRTCLCRIISSINDKKYHDIFQNAEFFEKLTQCINLNVDKYDQYSRYICENCYEKVLAFYQFQEMCRNSMKKFEEILESRVEKDLEHVTSREEVPLNTAEEKKCLINNEENLKGPKAGCELVYSVSESKLKNKSYNSAPEMSESTKVVEGSTFQCNLCPKIFRERQSLEIHQRKHRGLPPYTCSQENCQRTFNRWHYFQEHLKQHKEIGAHPTYKCDIKDCERVYKNKSALNIHKRKFHNFGPELKSHMCEQCGKVFKSSTLLSDHRFTHLDKSQLPYICNVEGCQKQFSKKDKLKIHEMRHAGIKNYVCPHCGMRKTTHNELKIHINYHTLERTWPCQFCSKVCNNAGNLKTHVRNIHERAKDFACSFCERTFAKLDTRKYHEMTHTGEKPHACAECGRRFLQPAALRTHRKIHSKEKVKKMQSKPDKGNEKNEK